MSFRARHSSQGQGVRRALAALALGVVAGCTIEVPYELPDTGGDASDAGNLPTPPRDTGGPGPGPGPEDTFEPVPPWDTGAPDGESDGAREVWTPPLEPDLAQIHDEVFSVSCASCHIERVSGGLSLRDTASLSETLRAASLQQPSMARVVPGSPDESYLWRKVTGSHEEVGGLGEPMPLGGSLTERQLELLHVWISDGAPGGDGAVAGD